MKKFIEEELEKAFVELIEAEGYKHFIGDELNLKSGEVLIEKDLESFLQKNYSSENISKVEVQSIISNLKNKSITDLYDANKEVNRLMSDGYSLKRENPNQKDFWVYYFDFDNIKNNKFRVVTQLEIIGEDNQVRIPDAILYINGIPVVVLEFKSAIREEASIYDAFKQITIRYTRDIPELFKYNAFCIISDGVNNKAGSVFADYEFFYAWRRIEGIKKEVDGIDTMFTLVQGMLNQFRILDIIRNFIYFPDSSKKNEKIVCRYPQYYASRRLLDNIKEHQKPQGDGKGGTYFGATGCGKSFTMLFLTRLLMKSTYFSSPTIVLITDRIDLDDQLSGQFVNAKKYFGDDTIKSVTSKNNLREELKGRESGGVFLTTIHKFTEDIKLLSDRNNIICISDEAHRSQVNLDQKIKRTDKGVKKTYGFAKYLHDSLPNATFVGFTGTPIDATLDVFGKVVDIYTMTESVRDEITVRIVYEGRAAKVILKNSELQKIEKYYEEAGKIGASEYQIEESKKSTATMKSILGDPDVLEELAKDFINHYESRVSEGSSVLGKAMIVTSHKEIAYNLYKLLIKMRPEWNEIKESDDNVELSYEEKRKIKPIERLKLIMTRDKDDPKELYKMLGTKDDRKKLDNQFKNAKSNFKIAIVVDMWLTGFDVPFLDTMYIYKPIQQHSLIQTISRVNRKYQGKEKGLVVDYIGIKKQMNMALKKYNKGEEQNIEDINQSIKVVKNHLDLLKKLFSNFNSNEYFTGTPLQRLENLKRAVNYIQLTKETETRFVNLVRRLKAAYDICVGSENITEDHRDYIHFYLAVRSILMKLTKGEAPDLHQMNEKVKEMIQSALESDGIQEILKIGEENDQVQDLFDQDFLDRIDKINLPNTKIKLLQKLLSQSIDKIRKINKVRGTDFSKRMESLVTRYNDRDENDILSSEYYEEIIDELKNLIFDVMEEYTTGDKLGIDFEEKAFYDILFSLCVKYEFHYPEDKLIILAQKVKKLVTEQAIFPDWNRRDDIKSALKVGLILLLDEHGYPPIERDEVYQEIFEQAQNYRKYN